MPKFKSFELTAREEEVLRLTEQGKTATEIGTHYGLTRERIRQNLATARRKIAARERYEAKVKEPVIEEDLERYED